MMLKETKNRVLLWSPLDFVFVWNLSEDSLFNFENKVVTATQPCSEHHESHSLDRANLLALVPQRTINNGDNNT